MWSDKDDAALRAEAMSWLAAWTNDGLDSISYEDLGDFRFRGEKIALKDRQLGIRKPAQLQGALSITTTYRAAGQERPYEDRPGPDGLMRYKWEKDDPNRYTNRGLRHAMERQLPLIWFWGVAPALYKPIFPVYLIGEEPDLKQFIVATDGLQNIESTGVDVDEVTRRYALEQTRARLHQPVFRGFVMRAYKTRCAICSLGHSSLLDAAHIVPDREDGGVAAVRNGISLCKIHHTSYDVGIIGITPKYGLEVRDDILQEVDGPMLEHGLKKLHGRALENLPASRKDRPDPELLAVQYAEFRAASTSKPYRFDLAKSSARVPTRMPSGRR